MRPPIKKERIFRRLMLDSELSVSSIAKSADLPKSYVSNTLSGLKEKGILFGTQKMAVEPLKLLREWGDLKRGILSSITPLVVDVLVPDAVKDALGEYVVSGPFAEMLVQGQSPGKPIIVYCDDAALGRVAAALKDSAKGRGSMFIYGYDRDIFYKGTDIRGWHIVSVPQLAADMLALSTYADLGVSLFKTWFNAGRRV